MELKLEYKWAIQDIVDQGRTTQENIDVIKTWLSTLDLKVVPKKIQDEMIVLFLLSCENDIDLTKNTIKRFYELKHEGPEIYDDRDMSREDLIKAMNTIHMASLPTRTDENYVIHYFKLNDTSYSNFDLVPIMKLSYMLVDISQEKNPPSGLVVVIDMKGFGLMHLSKLKLGAIKKYFHFLQEGLPINLKVIHVLNAVYFFDKVMSILKVFMKGELVDMIHAHPSNIDPEKLFSLLPKKCLPKDYGGDLPSEKILHEITLKQYEEKREFWKKEEKIRKQVFED